MQTTCVTNSPTNVMRFVRKTVGEPVERKLGLVNVTLSESVTAFVANWNWWDEPGDEITDEQLAQEYLNANDVYQERLLRLT
jgi:hypothetical protein